MRFWKRVIGPGIHHTPDGVAEVPPSRIKHWHDTLQQILAGGHKPPLSWGHLSSAVPHPDEHAYWQSRFQAGKVVGSRIDKATGDLEFQLDAPGVEIDSEGRLLTQAELPTGLKVKAAIEEVSVGARDWDDGHGNAWKDAPIHLALTPLPVWVPPGGQPPFQPGELALSTGAAKVQRFGTSTLLVRFSTMADDKDPKDPPKKDGPPKKDDKSGGGMNIKGIVEALREVGLTIPDEVADDEGLIIAIKAGGKAGGESPMDKPPETPKAEEPGAFLSTIRDPLTRGLVERAMSDDKAKRLARIAALVGRGLPEAQAAKLRGLASQVRFGADPQGKLLRPPVDDTLDTLEASLPKAQDPGSFAGTFLSSVQGAEEPTPEGDKGEKRQEELADMMARRAGLPSRASTNGK